MPDPKTIITWVVSLPAAIALIATLVAMAPWRRDRAVQPWGPALAICGGFAAAYVAIKGLRGGFPPGDAQHWLVYLGVPVVLGAVVATVWAKRAGWVSAVAGVALSAATVWLMTRHLVRRMEPAEYWLQFAIFAGGFVVWFVMLETLAVRVRGAALPLILCACAAVAALVLVNAHSLLLGQFAGAIAAALGAVGVVGLYFPNLSLARGGVAALTVVLLGVILAGHLFADLTTVELALLAIAPLMAWVGELPLSKRGGVRFTVRLVAVLAVLAIPLVPALKGLKETMQEQADSYSY